MEQANHLSNEEKKKKFEEQYMQHEIMLQKKAEEKEKNKEIKKDPKENMMIIKKEFDTQQENIRKKIRDFNKEQDKITDIQEAYELLNQYYLDSNFALNTYDKQQYKEQLNKLQEDIQSQARLIKPKKKFQFSNKNREKKEVTKVQEVITIQEQEQSQPSFLNIESIEEQNNTIINLSKEQLIQSTYKIINNKESTINIQGSLETVYIYQNDNCIINIGPVRSSIFIEKCTNCTINIMAQQIRIHNSYDCKFMIFSVSKSIIENCKSLQFGKYEYNYEGLQSEIKESGFEGRINQYDQIQDFNWIKQEKSPNYTLL